MTAAGDSRRATIDRPLGLRARADLQTAAAEFGGQASYMVHDPAAGESFHLTAIEHRLLTALRGPATLRQLQRIVAEEFPPLSVGVDHLQQFLTRLYDLGLIIVDHAGQGAALLSRGRRRRARQRRASWLQLLAIRLAGAPAAPTIERLYQAVRWVFSPLVAAAALGLVLAATALAIGHADELAARLPALSSLVQLRTAPLWIAAIVGVKILHELGHALACRHFGARPGEAGVLLLAGMPALYCDVTNAWRLPSKWQRIAVSGAGMVVELVLAAAAVVVWRVAPPGMLSAVCLSVIVVASVGTLAINANPLLRYDGYYILADLLETPNLAERSRGLLAAAWRRWLLGEPAVEDPLLGPRKRRALAVYAVAAKAYLALVLAVLLVTFVGLARPHGLENAVYAAAAVVVVGLLWGPAASLARMAANPLVRARLRLGRVAAAGAALAVLGAVAWFWPLARRVEGPAVIVPADAHALFAATAGAMAEAAPLGSWVEAGDMVARLANPELQAALADAQGEVLQRRQRLADLQTLQSRRPGASAALPTAAAELAAAEARLAEITARAGSLVIRAPRAGRVLPPPARPIAPRTARLPAWHGWPLEERNRGAWIEARTPVAVIAGDEGWSAWVAVDESDVTAVEPLQAARLLIDAEPTSVRTGRVSLVGRRARDNRTDDPDAARRAALVGDQRYHVVEIALDDAAPLFAGARGAARITTYDSTLGENLWRRLRQTFARLF